MLILIIGIVAFIIVCFVINLIDKNKEKLATKFKMQKIEIMKCPNCLEEYTDLSLEVCKHCNSSLEKKTKYKASKEFKKKLCCIVVSLILIILVLIVGVAFFYVKGKLDKIQKVELPSDKDLGITETTAKNLTGYRNIAIFGVDSRSDDYGVGNRSDCIIIASINNDTGAIKLISVYRDTYVNIEGHGLDKITHAYSYGEAPLAVKTLNTNLDLNINEFVTVNFEAVKEIVNDLGGVTITVTDAEATQISGINEAGTYMLNGDQALAYSRIRKIDTDYKRTERMRNVMTACLEVCQN